MNNSHHNSSSSFSKNKKMRKTIKLRDSSSSEENSSTVGGAPAQEVQKLRMELDSMRKKTEEGFNSLRKVNEEGFNTMRQAMAALTEEVFSLRAEVKRKNKYENVQVVDHAFLQQPLSTDESLTEFEDSLKNEESFHSMIAFILNMDGKSPQTYLRKSYHAIFDAEIAQKLTWMGTRNKRAAKNLRIVATIRGAFQRKFPAEPASLVEEIGKKFFHYAHDRIQKRK